MELSPGTVPLVRMAAAILVLAAVATGWEVLAQQAPSSPFHVGTLAEPVGVLKSTSVTLALMLLAASWLAPWAFPAGVPRTWPWVVGVGAAFTLGSLIYGATTGMKGVQIQDPRGDAVAIFVIRTVGQGILGLCLLDFARRLLIRAPQP